MIAKTKTRETDRRFRRAQPAPPDPELQELQLGTCRTLAAALSFAGITTKFCFSPPLNEFPTCFIDLSKNGTRDDVEAEKKRKLIDAIVRNHGWKPDHDQGATVAARRAVYECSHAHHPATDAHLALIIKFGLQATQQQQPQGGR